MRRLLIKCEPIGRQVKWNMRYRPSIEEDWRVAVSHIRCSGLYDYLPSTSSMAVSSCSRRHRTKMTKITATNAAPKRRSTGVSTSMTDRSETIAEKIEAQRALQTSEKSLF